ncbi:MAG: PKD domain-containing protein [Bacteroidetes bacterium]|nr:PKD domain-containing protein [Bacteroidota bacterium]
MTSGLTGCTKTGNSINVIVNPVPVATVTATGPTTFCAGDSVVLQANTGSGLTYQWKLNGNNISGAIANNFAVKLAGNYRVRVFGSNNCSKLSNLTTVNIPCEHHHP